MRAALALGSLVVGCHGFSTSASDTPDARESPQASAQPAILASPTTPANEGRRGFEDAGPPPTPYRGDEVLSPDTGGRELVGYTLSAALRLADPATPPRAPEVSATGLEAARKATELRLGIDVAPSRMRVALLGHGWVLPPDTELRARVDRYGHVVVWPGGAAYRPLAPGSLRALLGERRFDVAPTALGDIAPHDETGRRIGIRTRKVDVVSRAARASFEIGHLDGAGEGGVLLCRFLLDLMNASLGTPLCGPDELPVRADLRWTSRGSLSFELTGSLRRTDMPLLAVPPPSATTISGAPPASAVVPLLTGAELAALRTGDIDLPVSAAVVGDALVVANTTLELRLLHLDGVPVAWAAPGGRGEVRGLRRGKYTAQWRTFLGDSVDPAASLVVPGLAQAGGLADGGR